MFQLVYVSRALAEFSEEDLATLLARSRSANAEKGVTGMLLYQNAHFLQVLEGEEKVVRQLADKIAHDPRHHHVAFLHESQTLGRDFPDWSMGFKNENEFAVAGYSSFLQSGLTIDSFAHRPPLAKELLLQFKDAPSRVSPTAATSRG